MAVSDAVDPGDFIMLASLNINTGFKWVNISGFHKRLHTLISGSYVRVLRLV